MRKEKSCGAVVYRMENGRLEYLVEHTHSGKVGLPKGHVEGTETEIETALREIREETNLEVTLDTSFRHVIAYSPKPEVWKDVVFFLAVPCGGDIRPQPSEVASLEWLSYEQAVPQITYDGVREVLRLAHAELCRRNAIAPWTE